MQQQLSSVNIKSPQLIADNANLHEVKNYKTDSEWSEPQNTILVHYGIPQTRYQQAKAWIRQTVLSDT